MPAECVEEASGLSTVKAISLKVFQRNDSMCVRSIEEAVYRGADGCGKCLDGVSRSDMGSEEYVERAKWAVQSPEEAVWCTRSLGSGANGVYRVSRWLMSIPGEGGLDESDESRADESTGIPVNSRICRKKGY